MLYFDDMVVFGKNFEKHISNLEKVFDRLDEMNFKVKAKKCSFFKPEVQFLGHVVTANGIKTDPVKTEAIRNAARPTNVSELRSFLGLMSYRKFIKGFAKIAKCLHVLTSKETK